MVSCEMSCHVMWFDVASCHVMSPNIAPATKSHTPTSPNATPATKSDAPTSPTVVVPATKNHIPKSPIIACHEKWRCNIAKYCPCHEK